jgi:hypothetical protein
MGDIYFERRDGRIEYIGRTASDKTIYLSLDRPALVVEEFTDDDFAAMEEAMGRNLDQADPNSPNGPPSSKDNNI